MESPPSTGHLPSAGAGSSSAQVGHAWLIAAVCASLFCMPLMMAGVNAILPSLGQGLEASALELGLMGAFYALGLAVFQLAGGSLGEIQGYRRVFLWGITLFGLAGALLGFARTVPFFLALRFVQGVGGAMTSACGLAMLASAAPPGRRPAYLGYSGTAVYAGIACGPPVAGIVTGFLDWRWLFWCSALASAGVFLLMKYFVRLEWRVAPDRRFDREGCLLYAAAMAALVFGAACLKISLPLSGGLFAAFAVLLVLFCLWELRSAAPLLDIRLLARNRVFALSSLVAFVNYSSFFGVVFFFSLYLQLGKGMDVRQAGLFLALQSVVQALTAPVAARLCGRFDAGHVSAWGVGLCGCGLLVCAFLRPESSPAVLIAAQCLLGAGISLFSLSNTSIILESAGPEHTGQAAGVIGAVRTGGQVCNMTIITLTLAWFLGDRPVSPENLDTLLHVMHVDLVIFGLCNVLAVGCALVRNR